MKQIDIDNLNKALASDNQGMAWLILLSIIKKENNMSDFSNQIGILRESIYKSLSPGRDPRFLTIYKILRGLGCTLKVVPFDEKIDANFEVMTLSKENPFAAKLWDFNDNLEKHSPETIFADSRLNIHWICTNHDSPYRWIESPVSLKSRYKGFVLNNAHKIAESPKILEKSICPMCLNC